MVIEKELKTKKTKELYKAILELKDEKEAEKFFRDLCTFKEIRGMTERWQVAKLLFDRIPYRKISKEVGSSTATITRVARWLHHGLGGYKLMLDRLRS